MAVLDYRMGNLRSLATSLERAGARVAVVTGPGGLSEGGGADGLLLPGVGAFAPAMANLAEQGLLDAVLAWAEEDRPFLAVCVGMQLLFDESDEGEGEEDGTHKGLGIVRGSVTRLPKGREGQEGRKVPHMGWNTVELTPAAADSAYADALEEGAYYYFAHSYCARSCPDGGGGADAVLGTTTYGVEYASVVGRGRLLGTQFHPEKSARAGMKLIERFVEVCRTASTAKTPRAPRTEWATEDTEGEGRSHK